MAKAKSEVVTESKEKEYGQMVKESNEQFFIVLFLSNLYS